MGSSKFLVPWETKKTVSFKCNRAMPLAINPWDVMPLLNKIFDYAYYGRTKTNKNATSNQGSWCPANQKLLTHLELLPGTPTK
jgi:hypothetical protein